MGSGVLGGQRPARNQPSSQDGLVALHVDEVIGAAGVPMSQLQISVMRRVCSRLGELGSKPITAPLVEGDVNLELGLPLTAKGPAGREAHDMVQSHTSDHLGPNGGGVRVMGEIALRQSL